MRIPRQLSDLEDAWREMHFRQALSLARRAGESHFVEVLTRHLPVTQRGGTAEEDLVACDLAQLTQEELRLLSGCELDLRTCTDAEIRRLNQGEDWRVIQAEREGRT
jgi:hypothetical protein